MNEKQMITSIDWTEKSVVLHPRVFPISIMHDEKIKKKVIKVFEEIMVEHNYFSTTYQKYKEYCKLLMRFNHPYKGFIGLQGLELKLFLDILVDILIKKTHFFKKHTQFDRYNLYEKKKNLNKKGNEIDHFFTLSFDHYFFSYLQQKYLIDKDSKISKKKVSKYRDSLLNYLNEIFSETEINKERKKVYMNNLYKNCLKVLKNENAEKDIGCCV